MKHMMVGKHHAAARLTNGTAFACLIGIVSASSAALIFSIAFRLSWSESLMFAVIAAVFTFGVVFTIFEMRSLTK